MWAFNKLGRLGDLLDDIDNKQEDGADGADAKPEVASAAPTDAERAAPGSAFVGRSLGFLSSAAAAAGSAASVAGSAAARAAEGDWATGAVGNLGGMTSTLGKLLGPDDEDDDDVEDRQVNAEGVSAVSTEKAAEEVIQESPGSTIDAIRDSSVGPGEIAADAAVADGWEIEDCVLDSSADVVPQSAPTPPASIPSAAAAAPKMAELTADRNDPQLILVVITFADVGSLGIEFCEEQSPYIVQEVHDHGLAYGRGLEAGDRLMQVGEQAVDSLDWDSLVPFLVQRPVRLTFHRCSGEQEPRSPPLGGESSSVSTSGAGTSEEYNRCEEAAAQAEVLASSVSSLTTSAREPVPSAEVPPDIQHHLEAERSVSADLRQRYEVAEAERGVLAKRLEAMQSQLVESERRATEELARAAKGAADERDAFTQRLEELQSRLAESERRAEQLTDAEKGAADQRDALTQRLEELQKRLAESERRAADQLTDAVRAAESAAAAQSQVLAKLARREAESEAEERLKRILAEHEQALINEQERFAGREEALRAKLEELESARHEEAPESGHAVRVQQLEAELTAEKSTTDGLRREAQEIAARLEEAREHEAAAKVAKEASESALSVAEAAKAKLGEEVAGLKAKIGFGEAVDTELEATTRNAKDADLETASLEEKMLQLRETLAQKEAVATEAAGIRCELEARNSELTAKVVDLEVKLAEQMQALTRDSKGADEATASLEEKVSQLRETLAQKEAAETEATGLRAQLETRTCELTGKVTDLEAKLAEQVQATTLKGKEADVQTARMEEEMSHLRETLAQKEAGVLEEAGTRSELESQKSELAAKVAVLEAKLAEHEKAKENVDDARLQQLEADFSAEKGAGDELRRKLQEQDTQLLATAQQMQHLQDHILEIEGESAQKGQRLEELGEKLKSQEAVALQAQTMAEKEFREASSKLTEAKESEKSLQRQVEELRRDVAAAKKKSREKADQEKEAILEEAAKDMQHEFEKMMKGKEKEVNRLQSDISKLEKTRRDQSKDIERIKSELEASRAEADSLRRDGEGYRGDYQKDIAALTTDHSQKVKDLEEKRVSEERQKHELALNIRSLEERAQTSIVQLETQKSQLEQRNGILQQQLEASQQQSADLSISLGEATQRLAALEGMGASIEGEEARLAAEAESQSLRDRLRAAEDKLLDAQATRDMFAKETDMFRTELKVARDERRNLEEDLSKSKERVRELQAQQLQKAKPEAPAQQAVIEQMQKDFEGRMVRFRDEVQYLRQKCDEKEKRCENLLAEKSSLSIQLKTSRSGYSAESATTDIEAGATEEAGASTGKASGKLLIRTLPLGSPTWLRSGDEVLRLVVKQLALYPPARIMFFAYVLLLHIWVLFVLQMSAIKPPADITEPPSELTPPVDEQPST